MPGAVQGGGGQAAGGGGASGGEQHCLETLLRNIEGLLAIAAHNARQQQSQLHMQKGKCEQSTDPTDCINATIVAYFRLGNSH